MEKRIKAKVDEVCEHSIGFIYPTQPHLNAIQRFLQYKQLGVLEMEDTIGFKKGMEVDIIVRLCNR